MAKNSDFSMLPDDWRKSYVSGSPYFQNRKEFLKVGELLEKLKRLKSSRRQNCYWGADNGMHKSWDSRWNYLEKIVNMWHSAPDEDDPRPNLKSTFAFNATETAMTELYDLNLMPAILAWTKKGQKLAPIIENIVKFPIIKYDFNSVWLDIFQEALWFGNSYAKVSYTKIVSKKKFKKLEGFTAKEQKRLENGETAIYEEKDCVEHNDVDWIHVPLREYYPDSYARQQHGRNFAAQEGIWERVMSFEGFKAEFANRRGFVNIDKVKPGSQMINDSHPIFRFPQEYQGSNAVIVQEWECKYKDIVRYVANGVFIGERPLDNHKQLSIVHVGAIKYPNQYYYMGLADVLEGLQTEDEIVRNKFIELLELQLSPPLVVPSTFAGEFKEQYDVAKYNTGEIISISGDPREIQWMAPAITKLSEVFGLRSQIREDVISVSLIDPKASAQPTQSPTAFEAMQMTQATMKSFAKTLKSFNRGITQGLKIQWQLQRQEYLLNLEPEGVNNREGDKGEDENMMIKKREIFTKDVQIIDQDDDITIKKRPGETFPFYIKDEYLNVDNDDIDIIISAESQQPMSKISKVRKSEEAWAQLMPFLMQAKQDPTLFDDPRIMGLYKDYVTSHDITDSALGNEKEDEADTIERAIKQEGMMWKNAKLEFDSKAYKPVMGEFDEPIAHRLQHLKTINAIQLLLDEKGKESDAIMTKLQGKANPMDPNSQNEMTMTPQTKKLNDQMTLYQKYLDELIDHYKMDRMTFDEASEAVLSMQAGLQGGQQSGMGPQPPQGPQMPQGPGAGGMPPQGPQGSPQMPPGAPQVPMTPDMQVQPPPQLNIPGPTSQSPQDMQAQMM